MGERLSDTVLTLSIVRLIAARMISLVLKHYLTWHAQRVLRSMQQPRDAQTKAFGRVRRLLRGTGIAALTGFDRCQNLEACRQLPISNADSMHQLFDRVFEEGDAARKVFGRSKVLGFARTSGTSGASKYIPMNAAYFASLDRTLVRMMASHTFSSGEWTMALRGKRLLLGSRPRCGTSPTGLPICDISGLIPTRSWRSIRWLFTPRHSDLWIEDWARKAELILDQAEGKHVVAMTGIPALAMDFMKRARLRYNVEHLDVVWPQLTRYVYGAVHLSAEQRTQLRNSWFAAPTKLNFFETYFASEAPLAFAFEPNDDGLALNTLEILYLFRAYSGDESFKFAHELEPGQQYAIFITTPGGLVNYHMGDRIEVVSTQPLRIRVCGRETEELSLTGEKITTEQMDLALHEAGLRAAALGSHLPVIWAEQDERPYMVWGLPEVASDRSAQEWAALLDQSLCRVNVLYHEALVQEAVIAPSRVVFIPAATFEGFRDSQLGIGQHKPKRIFSSRAEFAATYRWTESSSSP